MASSLVAVWVMRMCGRMPSLLQSSSTYECLSPLTS